MAISLKDSIKKRTKRLFSIKQRKLLERGFKKMKLKYKFSPNYLANIFPIANQLNYLPAGNSLTERK